MMKPNRTPIYILRKIIVWIFLVIVCCIESSSRSREQNNHAVVVNFVPSCDAFSINRLERRQHHHHQQQRQQQQRLKTFSQSMPFSEKQTNRNNDNNNKNIICCNLKEEKGGGDVLSYSSSSSKMTTTTTEAAAVAATTSSTSYYFTDELNDQRYSTSDWLHNIKSIRKSTILRDIQGPISTIFVWASFVSIVHRLLEMLSSSSSSSSYSALAAAASTASSYICIPTFPHSMVVSALGLLLVFRTNSAYQRFNEGRKIWEQVLSVSRNFSRLSNLYESDMGTERKLRIARLLGAFPYLLGDHIQKQEESTITTTKVTTTRTRNKIIPYPWKKRNTEISSATILDQNKVNNNNNNNAVIEYTKIPLRLLSPKEKTECMLSNNRPMWICDKLSQEIMKIPYSNNNYTSRERSTFLSYIEKLSKAVGECERITQTAVPQNYARHALRSLTIWLGTLPFALVKDFGLLTGPITGIMAWLMFGVYEIGAIIEDPFQGSLKVKSLCDAIYNDVMYHHHQDDDDDTTLKKNPRESAYYKIHSPEQPERKKVNGPVVTQQVDEECKQRDARKP